MRHSFRAAPLLAVLLAACAVGPKYQGPPASVTAQGFARAAPEFSVATPMTARWWETFNDPALSALIDKALTNSPRVAIAHARIAQARAALRATNAERGPRVKGSALYARVDLPEGSGIGDGEPSIDFYNLSFDASWEADIWGRGRRKADAARADADAAFAGLADAHVRLSSEVAAAYISWRENCALHALAKQVVVLRNRELALLDRRVAAGVTAARERASPEIELAEALAQEKALQAESDFYEDELAILTGQPPVARLTASNSSEFLLLPPDQVAVEDPAGLIRRRPDIRMAERKLARETAMIGEAIAARFPSLSFTGILGMGGSSISDLGNVTLLALPRLTWSFLDLGRSAALVTQRRGSRDEAEAEYRETVLKALGDVEQSLSRFGQYRGIFNEKLRAEHIGEARFASEQERRRRGVTSDLELVMVQRDYFATQKSRIAAQSELAHSFVSLHKALGTGWQERGEVAPPSR